MTSPASEALNEVLHRSLQFPVAASELLQQQPGKPGIRSGHASVELQFFNVVEHDESP
jgi:hypothetical protein